jgi:hypothetical protein
MELSDLDYEGYGVYSGYGATESLQYDMSGPGVAGYLGMGAISIPGLDNIQLVAESGGLQVLSPQAEPVVIAGLNLMNIQVLGAPPGILPTQLPTYTASAAINIGTLGFQWGAEYVAKGYAVTAAIASLKSPTGTVDLIITNSPQKLAEVARATGGSALPAGPNVLVGAPAELVQAAQALLSAPPPQPCGPDMVMTPSGCKPHGKGLENGNGKEVVEPEKDKVPDWVVPVSIGVAILATTAFVMSRSSKPRGRSSSDFEDGSRTRPRITDRRGGSPL